MGEGAQVRPQRVFISYRRTDTAYPAGWLYDSLAERFGDAQIFKDVDSIGPGDDFVEALTRAVSMCDVLLALIGTTWLSTEETGGARRIDQPDDFVRVEIETALRRNVRVIPVLVEGATMPTPEQVPSSLAALTRRQAVELSWNRFNADVDGLIRAIESAPAPPPPPPRSGTRGPRESGSRDDVGPRWPESQPEPEDRARLRPLVIAPLACGAVGAVLMLLGGGEPLLAGRPDNLYSGTSYQTIQHALPSLVLIAAVLLAARPTLAAPWLVGAGITVLALDYSSTTLWVGLHAGYADEEVGVESLTLRTAGALLVLVAVVVAARTMRHAPPPVDWASGAAFAAASLVTVAGAARLQYHLPENVPLRAVAAAAPTAVFVLALAYVVRWSRSAGSAGPAVTVAGVTAAVVYALELATPIDQSGVERGRGSVMLMVFGLAALSCVGLWIWSGAGGSLRGNRPVALRGRIDRTGSWRR